MFAQKPEVWGPWALRDVACLLPSGLLGHQNQLRGQWCDAFYAWQEVGFLEVGGKSPFFLESCWWNMISFTQQKILGLAILRGLVGDDEVTFWKSWKRDLQRLGKPKVTSSRALRFVDFPTSQVIFQDSPKLMAVSHDVLVLLRKILHRHGRVHF